MHKDDLIVGFDPGYEPDKLVTAIYRKNEDGTVVCVDEAHNYTADELQRLIALQDSTPAEVAIINAAKALGGPPKRKPTKAEKRLAKRCTDAFEQKLKLARDMRQYAREQASNARAAERKLDKELSIHVPVPEIPRDVADAIARLDTARIGVAVEADKIRRGL